MEIEFRKKKLRKQYEQSAEAQKAYGQPVGRRYIQRINLLKSAPTFDAVCALPGLDCHPLKGDREGQWAVKLTGFWRLIFTRKGEELEIILIEEVSDHYGD